MGAEQCGAMSGCHALCAGRTSPELSLGYSEHSE